MAGSVGTLCISGRQNRQRRRRDIVYRPQGYLKSMALYMESCANPAVGPRFGPAAAFTRLYIPRPAGAPCPAVNQETNHSKKEDIMVSTIGAASLGQLPPARAEGRKAQTAAAETMAPAATPEAGTEAAAVQSAQSAATARVGEQLDAQFDAARVQRAQDEAAPASVTGEEDAATAATETAGAEVAAATEVSTEAAPGGGSRMAGSSSSSSSSSAETDYIAEADTNNDRKVSEEERIAYEKKQASEAERSANGANTAQESRAQEVQQAYLPQETAGSQLDTSA
jgi:hypothetical protein